MTNAAEVLDDPTKVYYVHWTNETYNHGCEDYIIYYDDTKGTFEYHWHILGAQGYCNHAIPPSEWNSRTEVNAKLSDNFSRIPYQAYCAQCNVGLRQLDYLCKACKRDAQG